ncbi:MAG: AAA-like domain-containing protein [Myxococcales bacterium]|nr:AAA-like domain-containing protein [Myxococcales bacterium]
MRSFSWLHLTDLHQGLDAQAWLWPGVKEILFEDLSRLHERCGPWDVVLFTGDITQRGSAAEFDRFNATLEPLWRHIESLGSSPSLLTVPGNHDLVRPDPLQPEALILQRWSEFTAVQDGFWSDPESPYRRLVDQIFANYDAWLERSPFPRPSKLSRGILPGEFAATISKDGVSLGIVGLNSAFLQIGGGDYLGKLALDVRQFHGACGGDGPAWVKEHELSLLLTHHPASWLSSQARDHFHGEIFTPGRFAAHICGHLHENSGEVVAIGGAASRRQLQGRSLFGLESFGQGQAIERSHGYAAGKIEFGERDDATLRLWPRVAKRAAAGHWRLIQDLDAYELLDDQGTAPEPLVLQRKPAPRRPRSPRTTPVSVRSVGASVSAEPAPSPNAFTSGEASPLDPLVSITSRIQPPGAPYDLRWHVHRDEEEQTALNYLDQPGAPVVLWGPEKFGKTWTTHYLIDCVHHQDGGKAKVVAINLDTFDYESRRDYSSFILELAYQIVASIGGPEEWVNQAWGSRGSVNVRLGRVMREHILPLADSRLIMAIDRVDAVWGLPFKDDCFGMLRAWAQDKRLAKLRLVLAISTTPTMLIDRPTQSPFNLTPPIVLGDFTREQVRELATKYGLRWSDADFAELDELIGGHPYLVRHVMHRAALAGGVPAGSLIDESTSLFDDFLQRYSRRLHNQPELLAGLRSLRSESLAELDPEVSHRLESAGLAVEEKTGLFRLRYRLYERLRL